MGTHICNQGPPGLHNVYQTNLVQRVRPLKKKKCANDLQSVIDTNNHGPWLRGSTKYHSLAINLNLEARK